MARQYDGKVSVVGVAGRDDVDAMREFVARHDLSHFPQVADTELVVWERFAIAGQPAWVLIDGETGAVETISGALGSEELAERLDALAG